MKRVLVLVAVTLGCSLFAAAANDALEGRFPRERLWEMLSNRDVYWRGEYTGLVPCLSPNAEAVLKTRDRTADQTIRTWLEDPNRFAIAHVLLTLSATGMRYPVSAAEWNTLRVQIPAAGEVRYDATQMPALRQKWSTALPAGAK